MQNVNLGPYNKAHNIISVFKGYENRLIADDNTFFKEENLSSDEYPVLSVRNKRLFLNVGSDNLHGLFSKEYPGFIVNGELHYANQIVKGLVFPDIEKERTMVSMGSKLLIFPDKVYFNANDLSDYGSLEAEFYGTSAECSLCRGDGDLYENYFVSASAPQLPTHGDLWVDTSAIPHTLKQYSAETEEWIEIKENYIRITSPGIGVQFQKFDGVFLSGFASAGLEGNYIIYDKADDYIVVSGIIDTNVTISQSFSIRKILPDMDFVCESGNRLWGCNSEKNEIYASKLGDPTNFYSFMGISSDSYAVTVGTDGAFTGVTAYKGYVIFFKEKCVHKVYGQNPPYTVMTSHIVGVQNGCHRSICNLNDTLYYKSVAGVYAYEGGLPVNISEALGNEYYTDAVSGFFKDKLYIALRDVRGIKKLFVYDTLRYIWHCEGELDVEEFVTDNMNLYCIVSQDGNQKLMLVDAENVYGSIPFSNFQLYTEDTIKWYAQTNLWGLNVPENKYYSNIMIKAVCEPGAKMTVFFKYDFSDEWYEQCTFTAEKPEIAEIPFSTPRCNYLTIRLEGEGKVKILSISRTMTLGSGVNV